MNGQDAGFPIHARPKAYALITAARNEEAHIERVILSVADQTRLPSKWIVVSDGSTDRTDEIVRRHAERLPFLELLSLGRAHQPDFASKVYALNEGARRLKDVVFDFIGHLDADMSFGPGYYADLLERFKRDPRLGVAGGGISEWDGNHYSPRRLNSTASVPGSVQLFRRECYESLGGFLPLPYGGEDWCAEVVARMNGWRVQSFPDLPVYHHGATTTFAGRLRRSYQGGLMDFSLGSHPLFEMARLARRLPSRPVVLGAVARLIGFSSAALRRERRIVSQEFVRFLRREELNRLRHSTIRADESSEPKAA